MSAIARDSTIKRSSRKGASRERTGREHTRRERSPVRGEDTQATPDDRHRSGPDSADHPSDQVTNVPSLRKRGLIIEAIADSMDSPYKKKKDYTHRTDIELRSFRHAAQSLARRMGPFTNVKTIFVVGVQLDAGVNLPLEQQPNTNDPVKNQVQLALYHKVLKSVPTLRAQVKWALKYRPAALNCLGQFLDKAASKGRSDDCRSLRDTGLKYIPCVLGIPQLEPDARKDQHGFCHHSTACLLCPRRMRDRFDEDRDKFCTSVQNGTQPITHKCWPSFLYPEDGYDPDEIDKNLLRGPFLLACFRHLFTGLRTALKATPGKATGKKSLADLYNMTEVLPEYIAYVAVLCRHVLNARESWTTQDGNFYADTFYQKIVNLFTDEQWAEETLTWWNRHVFGNDPRPQDTTPADIEDDVACLAVQRATRQATMAEPGSSIGANDGADNDMDVGADNDMEDDMDIGADNDMEDGTDDDMEDGIGDNGVDNGST